MVETKQSGNKRRLARREIPVLPNSQDRFRSVPAWMVSMLFHVCVLCGLGYFWVGRPRGSGSAPDRPVGVAVSYEVAGQQEYYLSGLGAASSESDSNNALDALPSAESVSDSTEQSESMLAELLPGAGSAGSDTSAASGDLGLGDGGGQLGGSTGVPKVKTTVFGIEGEGTRFLYVFDRSDSMNGYGGKPLLAAKSELLKSLDSLGPAHQFQIIFYNDSPLPFGGTGSGSPSLYRGENQSKDAAKRFVRNVVAVGGTRHIDALRLALRMGPDVVFFLTDADAAPSLRDLENLSERADRIGATIHAIQFGAGPNQRSGGWISGLASRSAGKYRYIDVTQLPE